MWERALFAGAYQRRVCGPSERPKYGGLNLMRYHNGACSGWGSCHLRLRRAAGGRATFVFGDSSAKPTDIAVADAFTPVMAPLLERIAAGGNALGRTGVDVRSFVDAVVTGTCRVGAACSQRRWDTTWTTTATFTPPVNPDGYRITVYEGEIEVFGVGMRLEAAWLLARLQPDRVQRSCRLVRTDPAHGLKGSHSGQFR